MSRYLLAGTVLAGCGVGLGALGAHGLKTLLTPDLLDVYKTGVNYQLWHALGLLSIAILQRVYPPSPLLNWAAGLMLSGILLFSGSLYALALLNIPALGIITPFGGLAFLSAWTLLAIFAFKAPANTTPK